MKFKISELVDLNLESIKKNDELDEIHYLDTANLTEGVFEEIKTYNWKEDKVPSRARRRVKENDILVSTVRPNQKHYGFITAQEQEFIVSTGFAVITPNTNKVDPYYLYQYLTLDKTTNYLQMIAENSTSAYPSIKPKDIGNLEIELPDLNKQKQIGKFLWDINKKIHLNSSLITNLEELAQTLFKHWFVDFEFPNEEGKPYKSSGGKMVESELGMIPEGWKVKNLDTIGEFKNGINYNRNTKGDTVYKVVNVRDVVGSHTLLDNELDEISVDFNKGKGYQLEAGDTVIVRSASPGETCFIDKVVEHYLYSGFCIRFRPNHYKYSLFSYCHLSNLKRELDSYSTGTTLKNLNQKILKSVKLAIPNDNILRNFQNINTAIMRKVRQQKDEIEKLQKLRDTLLPKLLLGEIELPDDMEVTDDVPIS